MIGGVALVVVVSLAVWLTGGRYVGTDNFECACGTAQCSTDASGLVKDVDVHEGQTVKKGDVLFRIDPLQFEIALANAKANLVQQKLTLTSMKDDYQRMLRDTAAQQAQVALDQVTFDRYAALLKVNSIAKAQYDTAKFTLATAQSTLSSLQDQAEVQLAKLGGNLNTPVEQMPGSIFRALSQVNEQQRQLSHTVVRAPFDGIVTQVDLLQPGTLVISALSSFSTTSAVGLVSHQQCLGGSQHEGNRRYQCSDRRSRRGDRRYLPGADLARPRRFSISPATGSDFLGAAVRKRERQLGKR